MIINTLNHYKKRILYHLTQRFNDMAFIITNEPEYKNDSEFMNEYNELIDIINLLSE